MAAYDQVPTEADVEFLFLEFLGREPSGKRDVDFFLQESSLKNLHYLFKNSLESRRFRLAQLSKESLLENLSGDIEWRAEPEQLSAIMAHTRKVWERFGRDEAHYSVLTNPIFRPEKLNEDVIKFFYETGAIEADLIVRICDACDVTPKQDCRVIELGCGLGRITEHLSSRFGHVVGVDISKHHLVGATERMLELGRSNTSFSLLPDFLEGDDKADLFVTFLVLQHNPPPIIAFLISEFLARLNPGGIAIFQVPTAIYDYRFRVEDYLQEIATGDGHMEMHALPQWAVLEIAREAGCHALAVLPDGHAAAIGISNTFVLRKQ